MAIKYKAVQSPNPLKKEETNKFYLTAISNGKVELKEMAKQKYHC